MQSGDRLITLKAGQHVNTRTDVTFRGFFSLGERQLSFKTQPTYTVEGVPVVLDVVLRYRITDPEALTKNYDSVEQALKSPCQYVVNKAVSHMSYQQFMKVSKLTTQAVAGSSASVGAIVPAYAPSSDLSWLAVFQETCLDELAGLAETYGIKVESFDVLDRNLDGVLGKKLASQSEEVLKNQLEATQVALKTQIATETERGHLAVAEINKQQTQTKAEAAKIEATTKADAEFYKAMKEAEAKKFLMEKEAEGKAEAVRKEAGAEAEKIRQLGDAQAAAIKAVAWARNEASTEHAQTMQRLEEYAKITAALPESTILFAGGGDASGDLAANKVLAQTASNVITGMSIQKGVAMGADRSCDNRQ